jgi:adenosylcobinamide kinase/adenosylcobinamide-phosphate guanylyltransferase
LVLGGTRSGKSEVAEGLLATVEGVTYVATGRPSDIDMAEHIAAHRARRLPSWATVEVGPDLVGALAATGGPVLVDSLGTWVAAHADLAPDAAGLATALRAREERGAGDTVLVSDEVGMGVHPPTEVGRRFADALGRLNRTVASLADAVLLVVAGRVLPLDRAPEGRCAPPSGS